MSKSKLEIFTPIVGAMLAASIIGFIEAQWLLNTTGTPDKLSAIYGPVLYSILAVPFGVFGSIVFHFIGDHEKLQGRGMGLGVLISSLPIGGFVALYQVRKVVYAEQMPPITTILGIGAGLFIIGLLFTLLPKALQKMERAVLYLGLVFLFGVGFAFSGNGSSMEMKATSTPLDDIKGKPNTILLLIDTLRADYVNAYNKLDIRTPNMDALAADGILYEQAISQASWTRPSGVSIFTGRIPSGHNTQSKAARVPDDAVLFTEKLKEKGVATAGFANNINLTATFNLNQGYDIFKYEAPDYPMGGTESVFGLTFYKVVIKVMERLFPNAHREVSHYYQPASQVFSDAKDFISANKERPWMVYAHLMEPHDPYFEHPFLEGDGDAEFNGVAYGRAENENPDPKDTEYLKKVYKHEIEYLDLEIGRFVDWLKSEKVYDNTVIVLVSDHGEEFGEHGGFWHGTTLYEEVLHVPLIVKTVEKDAKNIRVPWQVRSMDIAPTLTSIYGISADESWEGLPLVDETTVMLAKQWENQKGTQSNSDCMSARGHNMDRIAVSENDFEGNILSSIRMDGMKLILANKDNPRGLSEQETFDLNKDPLEKTPLANTSSICDVPLADKNTQLKSILGELIQQAAKTASTSDGAELDEATIERMKALGYMEK